MLGPIVCVFLVLAMEVSSGVVSYGAAEGVGVGGATVLHIILYTVKYNKNCVRNFQVFTFFWVIPRLLKFVCRRFGTLSLPSSQYNSLTHPLLLIPARGLNVGRYPAQPVSVL